MQDEKDNFTSGRFSFMWGQIELNLRKLSKTQILAWVEIFGGHL